MLVASVPLVAQALDAAEVTGGPDTTLSRPPSPESPLRSGTPTQTPSPAARATAAIPSAALATELGFVDRPIPRDPLPPASTPDVAAAPTADTDPTDTDPTGADPTGADPETTDDGADDPTDTPTEAVAAATPLTDVYAWDERSPRVTDLQRLLGVTADGWYGAATRRAHLEALVEADLPTDGVPERPGPGEEAWAALRQCESGGDYSIVSSSGRYRGAYQFDRTTWDSVAGRHAPELVGVDPAAASPSDQDAMARALYDERGPQPWPHCGRHLR